MDIVKTLKKKLLDLVLGWLLWLASGLLAVLAILFKQIFPAISLDKISKSFLLQISLGLSATCLGFVAYIRHLHLRRKLIYFRGLLWRKNERIPYCPRCKEVDGKEVHMKFRSVQDVEGHTPTYVVDQYACTNCSYATYYSEHPVVVKKRNKEWAQKNSK